MDARTAAFYDGYARQLAGSEARRSAMLDHLTATLAPGARVLDVGAGSGRDMAALMDLGFEVFGVEPNAAMRSTALRLQPALAGRLAEGALPDLGNPFHERHPQRFDAVVCSAVLMHVAPADLPRALASLMRQLRPCAADDGGLQRPALLISLPEMAANQLDDDRDADGRRFHNHDPAAVQALLADLGATLERASSSDAVLASAGTRWHTRVFRRTAPSRC
ncbi:class I SAM-dependent methyltransferase [Roseateles sp. DXS20W]|uniref:Class I SAM-dependent methyltransferase n=1 Tax=Pelomonas lactea TaxID=3299030 RepID=A0ABW7GKG1_9BURK